MISIQTTDLTKRYGTHTSLHALNLSISRGTVYCLLGQNGAGKTTTINLLSGFTRPSSGTVHINGQEVRPDDAAVRKAVAYIPEVVQLYDNLSGMENLRFFSSLAGYRYKLAELAGFLREVGLQEEAHEKRLGTYSKGMRQKVGIAIALAKHAEVILMDEPTSGLDPKATAEFTRICKELAAAGKTIFMATHDIFNAVNAGTQIGIMKQGVLVHTVATSAITADELQQLYLETI